MKLVKLCIKNYRSIKDVTLDNVSYENDSTTILVGVNESGKSNILKAVTLLDGDNQTADWGQDCNLDAQEEKEDIEVEGVFDFTTEKDEIESLVSEFCESHGINNTLQDYSFLETVHRIVKVDHTNKVHNLYSFDKMWKKEFLNTLAASDVEQLEKSVVALLFSKIKVIFWEPDETKYLVSSDIDLISFANNLDNIPLLNMFGLIKCKGKEDIQNKINAARQNSAKLEQLQEQLSDATTDYIKEVWQEQNTRIKVRIREQNNRFLCTIFVLDRGEYNKYKNFYMKQRSDGYKKFVSLILSLSSENKIGKLHDNILLIDEPEIHLHPRGCKDLLKELIKIGRTNNVIFSTHSIFMIDKDYVSRHWIVEKDPKRCARKQDFTYCRRIDSTESVFDDEVTRKAFGMSIINDMLPKNQYLVEGFSDKILLEFVIKTIDPTFSFLVRPCTGSTIIACAQLLSREDIHTIVIVDADDAGIQDKGAIEKNKQKCFTLKELNNNVFDGATIEDLLPLDFVQNFMSNYKEINAKQSEVKLDASKPRMLQFQEQFKDVLNRIKKSDKMVVQTFKVALATSFVQKYKTENLQEKVPLLYGLGLEVIKKSSEVAEF